MTIRNAPQEALSSRNSLLETFLAQQQEKEQTTPKRATNGEAGPPVGQVSFCFMLRTVCQERHVTRALPGARAVRGETEGCRARRVPAETPDCSCRTIRRLADVDGRSQRVSPRAFADGFLAAVQDDADSKDTWWLDEHTKEMLERDMAPPTGPDSALIFTVRDGEPLRLTKEQVRGVCG